MVIWETRIPVTQTQWPKRWPKHSDLNTVTWMQWPKQKQADAQIIYFNKNECYFSLGMYPNYSKHWNLLPNCTYSLPKSLPNVYNDNFLKIPNLYPNFGPTWRPGTKFWNWKIKQDTLIPNQYTTFLWKHPSPNDYTFWDISYFVQ